MERNPLPVNQKKMLIRMGKMPALYIYINVQICMEGCGRLGAMRDRLNCTRAHTEKRTHCNTPIQSHKVKFT